jgi:uncharacterized protein (TIGR03086 family)
MDDQLIADAFGGFGARLATVDAGQWDGSTPCADWDVRTLVNHVVGEVLWIPPLLEGKTIAEVGDRFDGDVLGDDPAAAWAGAVSAALAGVAEPGAQERTVHLSFGDFSGADYLGQITSDVVIHTWDLARAVGADDRLDPALVAFVDEFLSPQIDAWRSAGAFGPAVAAGEGADAQARLLGHTGRSAA